MSVRFRCDRRPKYIHVTIAPMLVSGVAVCFLPHGRTEKDTGHKKNTANFSFHTMHSQEELGHSCDLKAVSLEEKLHQTKSLPQRYIPRPLVGRGA